MSEESSNSPGGIVARNIDALLQEHEREARELSKAERAIARLAALVGTVPFVLLHLMILGVWAVSATGWTQLPRFDPQLKFLAAAASVESLLLAALVLFAQRRMQELADRRADLHLHISLLSERETTRLIRLVTSIARKSGIELEKDDDLTELMRDVEPQRILEEIKKGSKGA